MNNLFLSTCNNLVLKPENLHTLL